MHCTAAGAYGSCICHGEVCSYVSQGAQPGRQALDRGASIEREKSQRGQGGLGAGLAIR